MKAYFHTDQLLHHPKSYLSRGALRQPQEVPGRVEPLLSTLSATGIEVREPQDLGLAPILAVHSQDYLDFLTTAHDQWLNVGHDWGEEVTSNIYVRGHVPPRSVLEAAANYLADGSCPIGPKTWKAAYAAAQTALAAAEDIMTGSKVSFALCRPPGHHARRSAAGGFCYINNAAVAAEYLRKIFRRVTILDTDVHHGQGIQEIFYHRSDIQYVSIHGDPTNFYPVIAGYQDEKGEGEGYGFNLNLPMPHGSAEGYFFKRLAEAVIAMDDFQPECLVWSHGYDIYIGDPQSIVDFSTAGFRRLASIIDALGLPTVIVQEGGYALNMLRANSLSFLAGLGYGSENDGA